ncbi:protein-lysine methyltransferase METTL21C-like [Chanos chanos]|uniref:Protein-lysine methyltransferase METTL21C-like n=1 Tax=Chanos chanos TaxID=29144 RepID=A0A6J2VSB6_CHACN|nr:protein-lysine methyltransferase METTL21C-like [Chanos chanos]
MAQLETQETGQHTKMCREHFVGYEIRINESHDFYGATVKSAAVALCRFLESNPEQINLRNKAVLELGAGTGLVSIVASLLGAWVTAVDIPGVHAILSTNLYWNTRGRCKYKPQVEALSYNDDLVRSFPHATYRYDYIMVADVVHQHHLHDKLLVAMRHFCQPGTSLIWADKICSQPEMVFTERFRRAFNTTLLAETEEVTIYMAVARKFWV